MTRVAVLELPASFDERDARFDDVARLLSGGPPCDLALLGEASLTGYVSAEGDFDLSRFAEPLHGPTLARGRALARELCTALGLPLVERGPGGALYNAYALIDAEGALVSCYRKRHPWYPERWATPGCAPFEVVSVAGLEVLVAVCFDVHFVANEAPEALARADLVAFPSAWVDEDERDGRAPLIDGLVERFGVAVANPNWGPGAPRVRGQGRSRIVAPMGASVWAKPRAGQAARADAVVRPRGAV